MSEQLLSSGDVCEVLGGIRLTTLNEWVHKGLVVPVSGGDGQGDHRRFSRMQTVGLAVALAIKNSERSCALSYMGVVVSAFAAVSEEWLLKRFAEGDTHLVTIHHGKPLLRGRDVSWTDVKTIYQDTIKTIADVAERLRIPRGPKRGLAQAN